MSSSTPIPPPSSPPASSPPIAEEEQQRILAYERFISEVLRCRTTEPVKKSKWQVFIESAGGAALITVALGGLLGSGVTYLYQTNQANLDRERTHAQKVQDLRLDASVAASGAMWTAIVASDDLLHLATEGFLKAPQDQRDEIRKQYILADSKWRSVSKGELDFKLMYYYRDSGSFIKAWPVARDSVTKFVDCAGTWIEQHPRYSEGLKSGCTDERSKMEGDLKELESAMTKP